MLKTHKIRIIATSFIRGQENLPKIVHTLESFGFIVKVANDIFQQGHAFYANSLEYRAQSLREAILDKEVDIIWCFSGGYGAGEVISRCIDIKPSNPKILIGYSDITSLHCLFNYFYNAPSIHASCLLSIINKHAHHAQDVIDTINGKNMHIKLQPINDSAINFYAEAIVTGGNLSVFTTMIGTKFHPNTRDKILLLEDVGECGYRIARLLNHLSEAGIISMTKAIIFGTFTNSDQHIDYVIDDFASRNSKIPIFRTNDVGHGDQNIPVIFGKMSTLKDNMLSFSLNNSSN